MFDDLDRLRSNGKLLRLLDRYAQPGLVDRKAWQDRLNSLDGAEAGPMVKLHGELLAFGWIEQNSGHTPYQPGVVAACYRITTGGIKALNKIMRERKGEKESDSESQPIAA